MRPLAAVVVVCISFMFASGPVAAQVDDGPPVAVADSALAAKLAQIQGTPLRLDEALEAARVHSTALREAEAAWVAARAAVRRERGGFDPELFANMERAHAETPTASPFSGADVLETERTAGSVGARLTLPLGTEFEAALNTTHLSTNSTFATLDPQIDANGEIRVRQPLLAGFGAIATVDLRAAEQQEIAAQALYEDARLAVLSQVRSSYWDVYAAERDLAVLELIVEQAEILLRDARARAGAGLVGPNEVANAQVFLAQQRLAALDGRERLDAVSDRLARIIGARPADGHARFHPADEPPRSFELPEVDALLAASMEASLPLRAARARVDELDRRARAAGWSALPALDLLGSLGGAGLSGEGQDVVFGDQTFTNDTDGGVGDAWSQVFGGDFPAWSVGFELTLPLGQRSGRAERDRLRAEAERSRQQLESQTRALEERLRAGHRTLAHGRERLELAAEGVTASQEQVRIGIIEYRNGRSTAFELVRLNADLAEAQRRYSDALVRTAKAVADLQQLSSGAYEGVPVPTEVNR